MITKPRAAVALHSLVLLLSVGAGTAHADTVTTLEHQYYSGVGYDLRPPRLLPDRP
ncbi:hypothetical protein ACU686_18170 [Yinghuangia aomiensis]